MADAIDVARYILELHGGMPTMKLHKLVYYAQAASLLETGEPLFENRIEAWASGPAIPDLYELHPGKYMIFPGDLDKKTPPTEAGGNNSFTDRKCSPNP